MHEDEAQATNSLARCGATSNALFPLRRRRLALPRARFAHFGQPLPPAVLSAIRADHRCWQVAQVHSTWQLENGRKSVGVHPGYLLQLVISLAIAGNLSARELPTCGAGGRLGWIRQSLHRGGFLTRIRTGSSQRRLHCGHSHSAILAEPMRTRLRSHRAPTTRRSSMNTSGRWVLINKVGTAEFPDVRLLQLKRGGTIPHPNVVAKQVDVGRPSVCSRIALGGLTARRILERNQRHDVPTDRAVINWHSGKRVGSSAKCRGKSSLLGPLGDPCSPGSWGGSLWPRIGETWESRRTSVTDQ